MARGQRLRASSGSDQPRLFQVPDPVARPQDVRSVAARPRRPALFQLSLASSPSVLVRQFHVAFGLALARRPSCDIPPPLTALRQALLDEEVAELADAVRANDLTAIADALADTVYVAFGTALTYGIDLDAVLAEVHRSNMSKLGRDGRPIRRQDGKVMKGPDYSPPRLTPLLTPAKRFPLSA